MTKTQTTWFLLIAAWWADLVSLDTSRVSQEAAATRSGYRNRLTHRQHVEVPGSLLAEALMKVLLVVPQSNLPMGGAETQDVLRSGLEVTPLFSPVSQVTLIREISNGIYDGLWLAGHMDASGNFILDSNELLSASALTSMVRGRFSWVFINTCQSIYAAQMIQNETDVDVVCTITTVPDVDAYRTGALFAKALSIDGDVRRAYQQSRPGGNRVYVYLAGNAPFLAKR